MLVRVALFHPAGGSSSQIAFDKNLFSILMVANFFLLDRRHMDLAFGAASFSNFFKFNYSSFTSNRFMFYFKWSHFAAMLFPESRKAQLSATLSDKELKLTSILLPTTPMIK